jgi:protein-tyrosine phosphatase
VAIAATPHLRADFPEVRVDELADRGRGLRGDLIREQIALRVVTGAEASLSWAVSADDEQLRLASYDQRGSDLLIETPGETTSLDRLLYHVQARGLRVTLAHPERSRDFQREPQRLEALHDQGVLLQVNADSLLRPRRARDRALAEHLCKQGLVDVLASDGHRAANWRPVTTLPAGVAAAVGLVGHDRARWMACRVPEAIISGEPLPQAPEIERRKRPWSRRGRRTEPRLC